MRNDALAGGGVDTIVSNMIATGIKPRWQIADDELKERVQELWSDSVDEMDFNKDVIHLHIPVSGG